jgi:NhaP-type Na+/H+ or K+/H+ antiporter
MLLNFLKNILIVIFMLSLIVILFLITCRKHTHFKGLDEQQDKSLSHAFINRLYFVLTTIATIGYGDIAPASMRARLITIFVILTVFVIVLKAFDSLIDTYNKDFSKYISNINDLNPYNYIHDKIYSENKK